MSEKLGAEAKLYKSPALSGAPATGTWTEITGARDVNVDPSADEADFSTRASRWKRTKPSLRDLTIEFEMNYDPDDAVLTALRSAFVNSTEIALAAMDGDITTPGTRGLAGNFGIFGFRRNEPLSGPMTVSISAKASSYTADYTVAS